MTKIERLEAYHSKDPGNPSLACDYADALMADGRFDQARIVLTKLPAPASNELGVRIRTARCALTLGDLQGAARLLHELKGTEVDGPVLRHDLAFAQLAMGDPDAAAVTLAPALSDRGAPAAILLLHARLLHWRGDYAGGLQTVEEILCRSPGNAEALGLKALLLLDQGDRAAAGEAAQVALQRDRGQPEAMIAAGTLALWAQRLDESEAAFAEVLKGQPQSGRAWLGLGQIQMLRQQYDAAYDSLRRAAQAMPGHIGTWHALAWCQLLGGDIHGAKASYDAALKIDRAFGETHGGLAIVYALWGETESAQQHIKRAQRLDPKGRSAVYARSLLLLAKGRDAEARALIAPLLVASSAPTVDPLTFLERLRARMHGGRSA